MVYVVLWPLALASIIRTSPHSKSCCIWFAMYNNLAIVYCNNYYKSIKLRLWPTHTLTRLCSLYWSLVYRLQYTSTADSFIIFSPTQFGLNAIRLGYLSCHSQVQGSGLYTHNVIKLTSILIFLLALKPFQFNIYLFILLILWHEYI